MPALKQQQQKVTSSLLISASTPPVQQQPPQPQPQLQPFIDGIVFGHFFLLQPIPCFVDPLSVQPRPLMRGPPMVVIVCFVWLLLLVVVVVVVVVCQAFGCLLCR